MCVCVRACVRACVCVCEKIYCFYVSVFKCYVRLYIHLAPMSVCPR